MTVFKNSFSEEIYKQTYEYQNEGIDRTWRRIADTLASVEKDPEYWAPLFMEALNDFKFIPGGRIYSNAGIGLKGTTFINCFVDGFMGENQDSMEGIMDALKRQALILKSEGVYGFCADVMRPRGAYIAGIANGSPGAVKMLEMWDTQSGVITEGPGVATDARSKKKVRKGAQLVSMSVWHPDIEEFVTAKQTAGKLTRFNMSVLVTDEFMNAVENSLPWELIYPDHDADKELYDRFWDGNIDNWMAIGGSFKVYKKYDDANELWNLIMKSTYNRNEPGVLFVDTINRLNNLFYCEHITASNPCGKLFASR